MNNSVTRRVTNALGAPMLVGGVLVGSAATLPPAVANARPVGAAVLPDLAMQSITIIPVTTAAGIDQANPIIPAGLWGATSNSSFVSSQ